MSQKEANLTAADIREILDYCPATGAFTWRYRNFKNPDTQKKWNTKWAGKIAGTRSHGYNIIRIRKDHFKCGRLAWLIVTGAWPKGVIDHINTIRNDDRFCNLREATSSQNNANQPRKASNTSGFKGVSRSNQRWAAYIRCDGKSKYLGTFDTPGIAHQAYIAAAQKIFGEYARAA